MQLEELKPFWQHEVEVHHEVTELKTLRTRVERHDLRVKFHWAIEIVAAAFVIYWFGGDLLWRDMPMISHVGAAVIVIAAVMICVLLILSQRLVRADNWTLTAKIENHIAKRQREYLLLKNVAWWYIAPLMFGVFLYSYGLALELSAKMPFWFVYAYWLVGLLGCYGIYRLNLQSAETKIKPLLEQLIGVRDQLARLEKDTGGDES